MRRLSRNITNKFTPGPTPEAKDVIASEEALKLLFSDEINQVIVSSWTTKELNLFLHEWRVDVPQIVPSEATEIPSLSGVLLVARQQRDNSLSMRCEALSECSLYWAAMSKGRFYFLLVCLRFDNRVVKDC